MTLLRLVTQKPEPNRLKFLRPGVMEARIPPSPHNEMAYPQQGVTELLLAWGDGDKSALDELMPAVYEELRRLAQHYLSHERAEHTLQTTALVHEAYLRLVDQKS